MRFFCMPLFACNRQVDSLDKRQCNLTNVPSDVERYSRTLEELLLDMNHIKDLPKFLFRLPKLRRLCISDNDLHRLPPEVGGLVGLVELNISRNDVSDLPDDLRYCKNLLILDVSSNPVARLPDSITLVNSLTHLALNDTSLTRLPTDLGRLTSLRSLEVRENHLRTLPSSISHLQRLQRLDVGQNELDELPPEIGALRSLQELYADENSLEMLPANFLNCRNIEQLDLSTNRLVELPNEIGDLEKLTDLVLSTNCLAALPNSIGRLRRLNILKLDSNNLSRLTPAIGSCSALVELYLTHNLLPELPSTIGNLSNLSTLNVDKNLLTSLPSLIGNCSSLTVLSLRDNQITEIPLEIGKLAKLRVLDVVNNNLTNLPYTVNVLYDLQALWLSENQSQAMLKLQQDRDTRTGMNVLTCYLLPQQQTHNPDVNSNQNRNSAFLGGPKVHFGDATGEKEEEALKAQTNFERHNTPHPKPNPAMKNKQHVDGHVIPRGDNDRRPSVVSLSKKTSISDSADQSPPPPPPPPSATTPNLPKSSLKHPPVHNHPALESNQTLKENLANKHFSLLIQSRSVVFDVPGAPGTIGQDAGCRLKRVNTPHYGRQARLAAQQHQQQLQQQLHQQQQQKTGCEAQETKATPIRADPGSNSNFETRRLTIRREPNVGLGLSVAGGVESTPYIENDTGLFVSKLTPGAPAERAGLQIGDKLLEVNGATMINQRHDAAVKCIQQNPHVVEVVVQRSTKRTASSASLKPIFAEEMAKTPAPTTHVLSSAESAATPTGPSPTDTTPASNFKLHYTTLRWDTRRPLGMSMLNTAAVHAQRSPLRVEYITPGGTVDLDGHVQVGDEILSIDGKSLMGMRFDDALQLLQREDGLAELHLVVQRSAAPISTPEVRPIVDDTVDTVEIRRDANNALGLSIVGGVDHCSHPFGVDRPGVFISKIARSSLAATTGRLRVGDRLLHVNGVDLSRARHADAVDALKSSGALLRLGIRHDVQPRGLTEVFFRRRLGEPIGLAIFGGINGPPANPNDPTDEGIFIERVEPNSCAKEVAQLRRGVRIVEVNEESLLGCTKSEAAQILRKTEGRVRLLICDGFKSDQNARAADPNCSFASSSITLPSLSDLTHHTSHSTLPQLSEQTYSAHVPSSGIGASLSTLHSGADRPHAPPRSPDSRLSTPFAVSPNKNEVTTFPPNKTPKSNKSSESPENLGFALKLQKLENESKVRSIYPQPGVPKIGPLVVSSSGPDNNNHATTIDGPVTRNIPIVVKNEKNGTSLKITTADMKADRIEQQKQADWRKTRLASLDNESIEAELLMNRARAPAALKRPETENQPQNGSADQEIKFVDEEK